MLEATVKSASKIKLELQRGSLKGSALTPKLSIPSLQFWLHFTLICTFQRFSCMFITIQNVKCVLNTLFHFENFNLLLCANSAITILYFNKLLPRKVQIPLKLGTTCLGIGSKDHSLQSPRIYYRMHRNACTKFLWSRDIDTWSG